MEDIEQQEAQHLTLVNDIFRALRALQINRSLISVSVDGVRTSGSSVILATELASQRFFIDEISPIEVHREAIRNGKFLLRAAYHGIQVSGFCFPVTTHLDQYGEAIELRFPEQLHHKQRRGTFRAALPAQQLAPAQLWRYQQQQPIDAKIYDVSVEGIGVEFDKLIKPPIQAGELFPSCQFDTPQQPLDLALVAKHPNFNKQTNKYRCGFSFRNLTAGQSKAINHWVLSLQRAHKRKDENRLREVDFTIPN